MKITYIANARMPTEKAHGYQICKMCESFSMCSANQQMNTSEANKVEVELVVPRRRNHIKEDPFKYYKVEENFKIKKLPSIDLVGRIQRLGFWMQNLSFTFSLLFYLFLKKQDIIYSRDLISLWFLSKFKKNLVYEAHSLPNNFALYKKTFQKTKAIITINNYLKNYLIKKGISEAKILVAPDGVDLNIFNINLTKEQARKKLGLDLDKKIIGYTGSFKTLNQDKGLTVILESLALLSEQDKILFIAIGGTKDQIDYYNELAEQKKIQRQVKLIQRVELKELAVYQKACDILLMPFPKNQHYSYYMSPLKMFEYMASNRPIIASDLPSIREILDHKNSVLVSPDNPQKLAKGIKKVLSDKNLAEKISRQALIKVEKYSWQIRAKKIINFINKGILTI